MPTPTLDSLETALLEVDRPFDETDQLAGLAFHKTSHNTLGFADRRDFSVFLPWKNWTSDVKDLPYTQDPALDHPPSDSVLQEAFKNVLSQGARTDKCFIDLAHLWDGDEKPFFIQGDKKATDDATKSVGKALADAIEQVEGDNTPIVVRFLIGDAKMNKDEGAAKRLMKDIFWPDGQPLVSKNKTNAKIYLGLYSPYYDMDKDETPITLLRSQAATVDALAAFLQATFNQEVPELKKLSAEISSLTKEALLKYLNKQVVSLSWNHGKILAVNGVSLLTGGANFAWESASGKYIIVEQSCKIKGDAAVSAHKWQDYFFNYLSNIHKTDTRSFLTWANLADDSPNWQNFGDEVTENGETRQNLKPAPKSTDSEFDIKMTATEGVKVLCTAQLGDWHGRAFQLEYPVQIVQLIKDMVSNIVWSSLAKTDWLTTDPTYSNLIKRSPLQGVAVAMVDMFFTERSDLRNALNGALGQAALNSPLKDPYKMLRINPNAWASRTTRLNAIANATKSVILCQQRLILPPLPEMLGPEGPVELLNTKAKLQGERKWDGVMWPYDLMIAICYAIMPSKRGLTFLGTRAPNDDQESADVCIVVSNKEFSKDPDGGWGDQMDFQEFKKRLKMVMRGIAFFANLPKLAPMMGKVPVEQVKQLSAAARLFSKGLDFETLSIGEGAARLVTGVTAWDFFTEYDELVDRKVKVKRVLKGREFDHPQPLAEGKKQKPISCHCKVVCVDDAVMYVGSDNAYPSYNEEHGAWIEDKPTIQEWRKKFWDPLWKNFAIEDK